MAAMAIRTLVWAAFSAVLVPCCSAFQYNQTQDGVAHASDKQDIYSAQAKAMMQRVETDNDEQHGEVEVPDGAEFTSFKVNELSYEEIAGFISKDLDEKTLEHLFIIIHGKKRNGNEYWQMLNDVINNATDDGFPGTDREMAVLAPQFFSTKFNSGQYKPNQLAWDDVNAWQPGGQANHPAYTTLTSFDVLDGLIKLHSDKLKYPNLKNITIVGHSGGGQLIQRYSALGNDPPEDVHVRYIHDNPSSCMYFTEDRPILSDMDIGTSTNSCVWYNTWRYGFDHFPGRGGKPRTAKDYFTQYLSRDVVSVVGLQDTGRHGDTSCMGKLQGGQDRRTRNLIWFRYINMLARTDEDLEGFPGSFEDLPDWSDAVDGKIHVRLVVVEDAGHDAHGLFKGTLGRGALFHDGDIDEGWRPKKNKDYSWR
ncbi:hypothetical protein BDW62DRAFT_212739 [Aspergillus aurantiobrunneus]